jgi:DNA cross-link repair 1A protein
VPLRDISLEGLTMYLMRFESRYDRILGYRPTGWTFASKGGTNVNPEVKALLARDFAATFDAKNLRPSRGSNDKVMMYGVPCKSPRDSLRPVARL